MGRWPRGERAGGGGEILSKYSRLAIRYAPFGARYGRIVCGLDMRRPSRRVEVEIKRTPPQSATSCRQLPMTTGSHDVALPRLSVGFRLRDTFDNARSRSHCTQPYRRAARHDVEYGCAVLPVRFLRAFGLLASLGRNDKHREG